MSRVLLPLILAGCGATDLTEIEEILCGQCDATCTYDEPAVTSASHIDGGLDYPDAPPAGGDHDPCWTTWGVHPTDPGDEHWVHNLEHGGVVYLYDCPDGCEADVAALEAMVADLPEGTVILAPYDGLKTQFAAVAWERRLQLDCLDTGALVEFYERFVDNAPESVTAGPPGGCMETTTTSG